MADPRDPIENWLSTDIELMQPRPGAFERISSRARRRKATRALVTAATAFVIVAAAWTVPQFASLLPGDSGITKVIGESPQGDRTSPPAASPAPSPQPTRPPGPGTGLTGTSNPVPPAFRPTSVTFIGPTVGAALGQSGASCPSGRCTSVAGTVNYGRSWFGASTLPVGPPDGSSGVSQLRFLDRRNGWAFGPQLFATHDGGRTWVKVTGLSRGRVIDLSAVGGRAYAALAFSCTGTGADYAAGCTSFQVISATAGSDDWAPVPGGGSVQAPVAPGGLQIDSQRGYLLAGQGTQPVLLTGSVTGGAWNTVPNGSPTEPLCLSGAQGTAAAKGPALIAPAGRGLYLVCEAARHGAGTAKTGPLTLYVTGDGGRSWHTVGVIRAGGTAISLAVAPGGALVLATSTSIYYSANGKVWHRAAVTAPPPGGFSFVGMTTRLRGAAVPADSGLSEVFTTLDGGLTWRPRAIG